MKKLSLFAIMAFFAFTACNSNTEKTESSATDTLAQEAPAAPVEKEVSITINAGDDMKYDLAEIKVKEGQTVKLTLNHTGKLAKEAMGHNWALLTQGTIVSDFATKAMQAKDTDYIPAGATEVIVHTKLIGGGQSDTIEFQAPAKGVYEFICTFPGHSAVMKGTFYVE
jgi:azurin